MKNIKKLLLASLATFMIFGLCACSKQETQTLTQTISFIQDAKDADMSEYDYLTSNDNFKEISVDQLVSALDDENTNAIIYIGYSGCHNCQNSVAGLQEAAIKANQTIYYLNCTTAFSSDVEYYKTVEAIKEILHEETDENGNLVYLPEYEKDDDGNIIVDSDGNYTIVTDENGNTVYSENVEYGIYTPLIFQIKSGKINTSNYILGYSENNDYTNLMDLGGTLETFDSSGNVKASEVVDSYAEALKTFENK